MKFLIFFLLSFFACNLHSQVWVEPGAVWHYNYGNLMEGGFIRITYEKDTLINGQTCQQLLPEQFRFTWDQHGNIYFLDSIPWNYEYTFASGDTVFYLENDSFYVLYNFGAQPGDSWDLGVDTNFLSCSGSRVIVDSVGMMEINGQQLRWIALSAEEGSSVGLSGKAVERFGAMENYLFPEDRNCDSTIAVEFNYYDFTCYQDHGFPLFKRIDEDCEHLLISGLDNIEVPEVKVFPNPVKNNLNIITPRQAEIELFDHTGKLLFKEINIPQGFDVSSLSQGIYFLRIILDDKIYMKKIIKN